MTLKTALNELIKNNQLKEALVENVDENGYVGKQSAFRNTTRLTLKFPDNSTLIIDSFCSGIVEDVMLELADFEKES